MRIALAVLAAASWLRASDALAACGPFSNVGDAVKKRGELASIAESKDKALETARNALLAELLKRSGEAALGWRAADSRVRTVKTAEEQPDVVRLVRAVYDKETPTADAQRLLQEFSDALRAATDARKESDDAERCTNDLFGIGRGHVNTVVLVGKESQLGYVQQPGAAGRSPEDELVERLRTECLRGGDIRSLGVSSGLMNVTRVEGLTPFLDGPVPERKPVALTPDRALLVLAAEYEGRWEAPDGSESTSKALKLRCVRIMYLGQAKIASLQLGTYGFGGEGQNRIDLLKGPLSGQISGRLRDAMYVGIPIRKVMRYQTSRAAEDVLMDGQELELEVTRARTDLERGRTPAPDAASKDDTFKTSWSFAVADMPRVILRVPILAGLVLTDHPETGSKPVWTVGPALGLSYRFPVPGLGQGRYVSPEAFVSVSARVGDSEEVPDTLWGGGVQVDLSGYLGVGIAYMGDIRFTRPQWVFTLAPVPWISHALGLEKAVGD